MTQNKSADWDSVDVTEEAKKSLTSHGIWFEKVNATIGQVYPNTQIVFPPAYLVTGHLWTMDIYEKEAL